MELPLHRHGSHGCQEPSFDSAATAGRPRTATTICSPPAQCRLPHPGHASGLLFLPSRLGCHRPTRIPLQSESQSHFPTLSSTAKFLHFPSCLSQRPSCPLTLPPHAFFLPFDRPHSTHTHIQRSTPLRLPLDSFLPP